MPADNGWAQDEQKPFPHRSPCRVISVVITRYLYRRCYFRILLLHLSQCVCLRGIVSIALPPLPLEQELTH